MADDKKEQDHRLNADESSAPSPLSRRGFLHHAGRLTAAALAATVADIPISGGLATATAQANEVGLVNGSRRDQAFQVRHDAAVFQHDLPVADHPTNGDEERYSNRIASYSKGLPHNSLGEVDLTAYSTLLQTLSNGTAAGFEELPQGCSDSNRQRRFVNPQAGLAFDLEGTDSHQLAIPPPPAFASAEQAGEAVELYWMALARDVPFVEYDTHPLVRAAAQELSLLTDFRGPKVAGRVTPSTVFRGFTGCDLIGPYVSQFLWKTASFGVEDILQTFRSYAPGVDYLTSYSDWLDAQNGCLPSVSNEVEHRRHSIRDGRDLAAYVHVDVLFQAYFNACLILLDMGVPFNLGNPYRHSRTQDGFGTFGDPHIITLVAEVATRALKAVWYQKWYVHRRLRPEEFGGRVHNHVTGGASYSMHPDVLNSAAVGQVNRRYGTYLLPQAYPEGSPLHPAYGAGHATVAGACVTILKAFFDESFVIPDPVIPTPEGSVLRPYTGGDAQRLTVGGELNKLAANIALGRNFAGIHWRTDYTESLKLGEAVAISILRDQRSTYNEDFGRFTFTKFDGSPIVV